MQFCIFVIDFFVNESIVLKMNQFKTVILIFISIMMFISCSDDGVSIAKKKFKVAAILDLSGHYSQFGKEAKIGIDMSLSDYKDGDFEVVYFDSKGEAPTAIDIFNTISQDTSYKVVVTFASWISNAIAPMAKEKDILHFAIASAVFDYPANGNTIRFTGDVTSESIFLTDYLKQFNSIGLMYFDNDYGKGWQNRLSQELASKLILSKSYTDTDTDFTSILQELNAKTPDAIVLISTTEAVQIARQAKSLGITSKLIGTRPIITDSLLKEPSAEGLVFSYPDLNEDYPPYQSYLLKYGTKPSSFVAEGYDLTTSLYGLTNNIAFNRDEVYKQYKNMILIGMFAMINFDENAQAESAMKLMLIKNGKYQDIQ
jgi:ABC-type branched-subunit amino acid transport system substrate-binding protein